MRIKFRTRMRMAELLACRTCCYASTWLRCRMVSTVVLWILTFQCNAVYLSFKSSKKIIKKKSNLFSHIATGSAPLTAASFPKIARSIEERGLRKTMLLISNSLRRTTKAENNARLRLEGTDILTASRQKSGSLDRLAV